MTEFLQQAWQGLLAISPLEWIGFVSGLAYVVLNARQNMLCWPVGVVSALATTALMLRLGLYSAATEYFIYFWLILYGWWSWRHPGAGRPALPVTHTPRAVGAMLLAVAVAGSLGVGALTSRLPGVQMSYFDATTSVCALVAQYMIARKYLEAWMVWIFVNALYVYIYGRGGAPLYALQSVLFLGLAFYGLAQWWRSLSSGGEAPA